MRILIKFWNCEHAAVSMEYAVIGASLSIVIIAGATSIGTTIKGMFFGPVTNSLK